MREAIEAAAVRQARTLLAAPRRTFTRAQIRRAVERTEAEMLPGRARAAVWLAPEAGRRVPPRVRSVGSMRDAAPPADVAAFLARAGVPFDPEANPRRRKRRMGAELDRRGGAYVFRVDGIRRAAADRILAGLHAEGLRAASRSASRARSGVLRSRFWELIFPRVVDVAAAARGDADADSPSPEALVEHARRHGAAVAMLYMPGGREGGLHAVALSLVPTPRGRDGLARPGATTFRAAVYDPHGEPTYRRGALEAWLRAGQASFASGSGATPFRGGPARPSIQIRLEHCEGLARAAVQYGREGSCVPGALALIVRLAAMRGNRRGGCARPYQQLLREDAVLAAQLVTWYGVLLRDFGSAGP